MALVAAGSPEALTNAQQQQQQQQQHHTSQPSRGVVRAPEGGEWDRLVGGAKVSPLSPALRFVSPGGFRCCAFGVVYFL